MPKLSIAAGSTSQTVDIFLQDSTSITGAGKTGLLYSGLSCYFNFPRKASTSITLSTLASSTAAYSSGGLIEIDGTHQPGKYRFDVPDACLASANGRYCNIMITATSIVPCLIEIELTNWDNQSTILTDIKTKTDLLTFDGSNNLYSTLDNITNTIPSGAPTVFSGRFAQLFYRFFGHMIKDSTAHTIKMKDAAGTTTYTTQTYTDDGAGNETYTVAT